MTMFHSMHATIARLNADKLRATPHVVPQPGLLRAVMGDDAFLAALDERRRWIAAHRISAFDLNDFRDEHGSSAGKLYRFEMEFDAIAFRIRF